MKLIREIVVATLLIAITGCSAVALEIRSHSFKNSEMMPDKHAYDDENTSPALDWSNVPGGTKSFVIICDDPDAPMGTWVHWVIYDLPGNMTGVPDNVPKVNTLPNGAKQGMNDFKAIGYRGPAPPPGKPHRYFFKLYALDMKLNCPPRLRKDDVLKLMKGHILGQAELIGLYKR